MITADQIVLHCIGDYLTQSDWMATNKTKGLSVAWIHALVYGTPFVLLAPSRMAFWTIIVTHALIDRYRIARYIIWLKNWLGPNRPWAECSKTGYPDERPVWMSVWLMIIADNVLHILINGAALRWL